MVEASGPQTLLSLLETAALHPLGLYVRDIHSDLRTFRAALHAARKDRPDLALLAFRTSPERPQDELWIVNVPPKPASADAP